MGLIAVESLLDGLNDEQKVDVRSQRRHLLIPAATGAGKTDVVARRIAWHLAIDGASKNEIVAFTFTERAAEEMKFRIRKYVAAVTPQGADATLGDMYVGTIHGFCLDRLRTPTLTGITTSTCLMMSTSISRSCKT
jgi:DNA helicase-2/ATP-dependent DNA helicase PcrA